MQSDMDYRDSQNRIQRAWHDRNPNFCRECRNKPSNQEAYKRLGVPKYA